MCSKLEIFYIIVTLTCVNYLYTNGSEIRYTDVRKCSINFTTYNYDYDETLRFPIEEIQNESGIFLTFFAKGDRDAHIIFSPDSYPKQKWERAYEIVLGYDSNRASVIRLHRFNNTGGIIENSFTLNKEWSQYWIQISPAGEIQVGKGNEKASMIWKDPNRMPVNHYGFSSYENSAVHWSLPCSRKMKNAIELEKELFENFSKSTPNTLGIPDITIRSRSAIMNSQSLDINAAIKLEWKDDTLRWNTSESDVTELHVNFNKVKNHNITIQNFKLVNSGNVTISFDGTVTWTADYLIPLESCLPKENPLCSPLLNCSIELRYSGKNIKFNALNDPSPNVSSFDLNENVTLSSDNNSNVWKILLKYTRQNITCKEDPKGCSKNLTTTLYDYSTTFPIEEIRNQYEIFLSFFVQAERDAHIIFSPKEEPAKRGEKVYEIVLGSNENTASSIRTSRYGGEVFIHKEANIVSGKEWRQFWIQISSNGFINVGKDNERSAFMRWKEDYPLMIKHYSFSSLNDNQVKWLFSCSSKN